MAWKRVSPDVCPVSQKVANIFDDGHTLFDARYAVNQTATTSRAVLSAHLISLGQEFYFINTSTKLTLGTRK
jgi:hypothetical protein